MRYLILILLSLFSLLAKPLKVASYNVENLFDAKYQGTEYKEYIPHKHNWNNRMAQVKLEHTAEVICDLNADIIGLQEVENGTVLQQLQQLLGEVGCPYRYRAISHKKGSGVQVALLSRYPISQHRDIVVSRSQRVRNILEATVEVEGQKLRLFVNHWKSKGREGYESKRILYAKALKRRLESLPKGSEYIVLGDFNSDYNAYETLSPRNDDTQGGTAFNDILPTKIAGGLVSKRDLLHYKEKVLYSLWLELPIEKRWSQKFFGKRGTPDQIVIPYSMVDGKGIDYVDGSFGVFHRGYLFTKRGYINRWRYKHGKHLGKGYSDHLPIYAWFDTVPFHLRTPQSTQRRGASVTIDHLYTLKALDTPVLLKDVKVIFKRGRSAIIKQRSGGRGIMLYGCAGHLVEGGRYDLQVEGLKSYKGLKELLGAHIVRQRGTIDPHRYTHKHLPKPLQQNEVVAGIEGVYRDRYLYLGGQKLPIYFKKRIRKPKEGTKIKVLYGQIGYYKRLQLVIYSQKDFQIME